MDCLHTHNNYFCTEISTCSIKVINIKNTIHSDYTMFSIDNGESSCSLSDDGVPTEGDTLC